MENGKKSDFRIHQPIGSPDQLFCKSISMETAECRTGTPSSYLIQNIVRILARNRALIVQSNPEK